MTYPVQLVVLGSAGEAKDPESLPEAFKTLCKELTEAAPQGVLKTGIEELDKAQLHQAAQIKMSAAGDLTKGFAVDWSSADGHVFNPETPWDWLPTSNGNGLRYAVHAADGEEYYLFVQYAKQG